MLLSADQLQGQCVPVILRPGEARDLTIYGLERPPVILRGTVQDTRARGLPGVRVSGAGRYTSTGASGDFEIEVPARDGPTPLTFELEGYQPKEQGFVAGVDQVVRLDHEPLAVRFQVVLVGLVEGAMADVQASLDGVGAVASTAPGRFRADALQPRVPYTLRVRRTGYPEVERRFTLQPGASEVELDPIQLIHGSLLGTHALSARVIDPAGAPVAGAQVDVSLAEPTRGLAVATQSTGEGGRFSVPVAADEAYQIVVSKPGYTFDPVVGQAPDDGAGLMVGPSFVAELGLTPVPLGGEIAVTVRYDFGWLPPGEPATVTLSRAGEVLEPQLVAPAQGRFVFENRDAGRYTVRVERPGFRAVVQEHTLDLNRRSASVDGRLVLQDLAAARPRVDPGTVLPAGDLRAGGDRPPVRLVGARLAGLVLDGDFTQLDLSEADLSGANLTAADLRGARLSRASLAQASAAGTRFDGANLSGADLTAGDFAGANFVGAQLDDADGTRGRFQRAVFVAPGAAPPADPCGPRDRPEPERASLAGMRLTSAFLGEAALAGADLRRVELGFAELDQTHLSGACLQGADLTLARLHRTHLDGADLRQASMVNAILTGADLRGANLRGATLFGIAMTQVDLGCAQRLGAWPGESYCVCPGLGAGDARCPAEAPRDDAAVEAAKAWDGCRANLSDANLSGAVIAGSNLTGANLFGSRLVGVDLSAACALGEARCQQTSRLAQANFTRAQLPGMLVGSVDLTGACFRDAELTSIEFSKQAVFTAADFGGAVLEGARMDEADLRGASFRGASMARAQLRSSTLDGVDLSDAALSSAEIEDTSLVGTRFAGADLKRVDLSPRAATGLDLSGADLEGADVHFDERLHHTRLTGADLRSATLSGALTRVDLRGATLVNTLNLGALTLDRVSFEAGRLDGSLWTIESAFGVDWRVERWAGGGLQGPAGPYPPNRRFQTPAAMAAQHCIVNDRALPRPEVRVELSSFDTAELAELTLSGLDFRGTTLRGAELGGCDFTGSNFDGFDFARASGPGNVFDAAWFRLGGFDGARLPGAFFRRAVFYLSDLKGLHAPGAVLERARLHLVRWIGQPDAPLDWSEADLGGVCLSGSTLAHLQLKGDTPEPVRGGSVQLNYSHVSDVDLSERTELALVNHSSVLGPAVQSLPPERWVDGRGPDYGPRRFEGPELYDGLCHMIQDACGPNRDGNPCDVVALACDEYDVNQTACDFEWCAVARQFMCGPDGQPRQVGDVVRLPGLPGQGDVEIDFRLSLDDLLPPCEFLLEEGDCQNSVGRCALYEGATVSSDLAGEGPLAQVFAWAHLGGSDLSRRDGVGLGETNLDGATLVDTTLYEGDPRRTQSQQSVTYRGADLRGLGLGDFVNYGMVDLTGARTSGSGGAIGLNNARVDTASAPLIHDVVVGESVWMPNVDLRATGIASPHFVHSDLRGLRLDDVPFPVGAPHIEASNLDGANLAGLFLVPGDHPLRIQGSSMRDAHFEQAQLPGADFEGTVLDGSRFSGTPEALTNLRGAVLDGATMLHGHLDFTDLRGASFEGFWLGNKDLTGSVLSDRDAPLVKPEADLSDAVLEGARLDHAQLPQLTAFRVRAAGVHLADARLEGARVSGDLSGATLAGAHLTGAHLIHVDLQGADLSGAHLQGTDLWGADLRGADLRGIQLDAATRFVGATVCADTLPEPLSAAAVGAVVTAEGCP